MNKLLIFGNSILKGVTFNGAGYHLCADHALEQLAERGTVVENHARMGTTVEDGLRAMERFLPECDRQTTVLLGFGGNDCDFDWQAVSDAPEAEHRPKVSPERFVEGMRRAIRKAQDAGAMVAVASLVPLETNCFLDFISRGRDRAAILSWLGDREHLYRWQEYYNVLTVEVARAFGCRVVDLRTAFLKSDRYSSLLSPDGIHPSEAGYAVVHGTMLAALG